MNDFLKRNEQPGKGEKDLDDALEKLKTTREGLMSKEKDYKTERERLLFKVNDLEREKKELEDEKREWKAQSKQVGPEMRSSVLAMMTEASKQISGVQTQIGSVLAEIPNVGAQLASVENQKCTVTAQIREMSTALLNCNGPVTETVPGSIILSGIDRKALRAAFRTDFYNTLASDGLGSLELLNLTVRNSLVLSHFSTRLLRANENALPFYPYIALVQSSGSGKSRLLQELGRTLPVVYGSLANPNSRGYPLSNPSLRNYLLYQTSDGPEAIPSLSSDECEARCEALLLTAFVIFYLFYTEKVEDNNIVLPLRMTKEELPKLVRHRGFKAIGIREPNGKAQISPQSDFFWELVTGVATVVREEVRYEKITRHKECDTPGSHSSRLQKMEVKFRSIGKGFQDSPRTGNEQQSQVSKASAETEKMMSCESANVLASQHAINMKQLRDEVFDYIHFSHPETNDWMDRLRKTAISVQRCPRTGGDGSHGKDNEPFGQEGVLSLPGLIVALDESRCLTNFFAHSPVGGVNAELISIFRCLRRVAHLMSLQGLMILLLFADTTSKIANFTPKRELDPSARLTSDSLRPFYAGQVFSPFLDLGTKCTGMLLDPTSGECDEWNQGETIMNSYKYPDFRKRMQTFCETWEVTDLALRVAKQVANLPPIDGVPIDKETDLGIGETVALSTEIFQCEEDYVCLGRPLWVSTLIYNRGLGWQDLVVFARTKLLGGVDKLSAVRATRNNQLLACLACRVPLQFSGSSPVVPHLVAEHMAWCRAISWDREVVYTDYINEPIVSTGAALLWEDHLPEMVETLIAQYGSHISNKGDLGQLAACIFVVHAVDNAYKRRADWHPDRPLEQVPEFVRMFKAVKLHDVLKSLFPVHVTSKLNDGTLHSVKSKRRSDEDGSAWKPILTRLDDPTKIFVPESLAQSDIRFKSIKRAESSLSCRDIPLLFEANVAVCTMTGQEGIDIIVPLRCPSRNATNRFEWTVWTIQVKNRKQIPRSTEVAGMHLDPIWVGAVRCVNSQKSEGTSICRHCEFMKENHFGTVINFQDGNLYKDEREYGRIWSFVRQPDLSEENGSESQQPPNRKRARLAVAGTGVSRSYLVVNSALTKGQEPCQHVRKIVLQRLNRLSALDTVYSVAERKYEDQNSAVESVVAACATHTDAHHVAEAARDSKELSRIERDRLKN